MAAFYDFRKPWEGELGVCRGFRLLVIRGAALKQATAHLSRSCALAEGQASGIRTSSHVYVPEAEEGTPHVLPSDGDTFVSSQPRSWSHTLAGRAPQTRTLSLLRS